MCDIIMAHLPTTTKKHTFGDRKVSSPDIFDVQLGEGDIYESNFYIPKDYKYVLQRYRLGQEKGSSDAGNVLDEIFAHARGVPNDYKEAEGWLRKVGEHADEKTQHKIGLIYEDGGDVSRDYKEAVRWFRKVAEKGNGKAQYKLGLMYESGKGVPQDYKEAERWFRRAAYQQYKKAQFHMGLMHANGVGIHQDYVLGHTWFHLAGLDGNETAIKARNMVAQNMTSVQMSESKYLLAQAYSRGVFVDKNSRKAIELARKSAEEGHAGSQCFLGEFYADEVEKRFVRRRHFDSVHMMWEERQEAIKWHSKAAGQGFAKSQFGLGLIYSQGKGFQQDYVLAYMWFDIAGSGGNKIAIKARDILENEMTSTQIAEAHGLACE